MSGGNLAFPMSISATSSRTINPTASWCRSRWRWGHDNRSRNASSKARAKLLRDHGGQALTYVHYESDKLLTKDEARRIAANVAKLPELRFSTTKQNCGDDNDKQNSQLLLISLCP